jgi:hypothetical protein
MNSLSGVVSRSRFFRECNDALPSRRHGKKRRRARRQRHECRLQARSRGNEPKLDDDKEASGGHAHEQAPAPHFMHGDKYAEPTSVVRPLRPAPRQDLPGHQEPGSAGLARRFERDGRPFGGLLERPNHGRGGPRFATVPVIRNIVRSRGRGLPRPRLDPGHDEATQVRGGA